MDIPNHIPPIHTQLPNANKLPNAVSSRRPSAQYPNTQYPKPAPTTDQRFTNSSSYNTDNRIPGPQYDSYNYSSNQDNWSSTNPQSQILDSQKPYHTNEPSNTYGSIPQGGQLPASYRVNNRQEPLQHQQTMDQSSQQYINQGRRLSSTVRQPQNQGLPPQQQQWNTAQNLPRRQSVLAQPSHDTQAATFVDGGTAAYGRNEFRGGTVHSEGPLDRTQPTDQAYRQTMDQGHPQQGYPRSAQDQQMFRQQPHDQQMYRQTAAAEQEIVNGARQGPRPSIDYFDHYKRPPSRDSSVDRYGRRSRQPSVEATAPSGGSRAGSVAPQPPPTAATSRPPSRAATPAGNGHLTSGRGSISRASSREHQPFEESLLRKRTLGQDISPSPYQPKRTESLFVAQNPSPAPAPVKVSGGGGGGGGGGGRKVSCRDYLLLSFLTFQFVK